MQIYLIKGFIGASVHEKIAIWLCVIGYICRVVSCSYFINISCIMLNSLPIVPIDTCIYVCNFIVFMYILLILVA